MKNIATAVIVVGLSIFGVGLLGQTPAPKSYVATDAQEKDLRLAVRDVQYAQITAQQANQDVQAKLAAFNAQLQEVEKANGWPTTIAYNVDAASGNVTFVTPPAPVATKPEPSVNHTPAATPAPTPKPTTPVKP